MRIRSRAHVSPEVLRPGALLLAAFLAACGGVSATPPGDGGSGGGSGGSSSGGSSGGGSGSGGGSSGGSSSGSSSGGGSPCPASPPKTGTACTDPSLSCEYGSDPNLDCDTLSVCLSGAWSTTPGATGGECPTSPPGVNGCPGSFGAVPVGKSCSGASECAYPQGRCACTIRQGGPVQIGDAGSIWECEQPNAGCPEPRPHAGTACPQNGQACDYGSCTLPGGTQMVCSSGRWISSAAPCPVFAGRARSDAP